jgi:hypothetical protein
MERHPDIDWTCAAQSVAMEIARDEQELLEALAETFANPNSAYKGKNQ